MGGLTFSAGFGFFPSLFGLQFHTFGLPLESQGAGAGTGARGAGRNANGGATGTGGGGGGGGGAGGERALSAEERHQLFLSRLLLFLGALVVILIMVL